MIPNATASQLKLEFGSADATHHRVWGRGGSALCWIRELIRTTYNTNLLKTYLYQRAKSLTQAGDDLMRTSKFLARTSKTLHRTS